MPLGIQNSWRAQMTAPTPVEAYPFLNFVFASVMAEKPVHEEICGVLSIEEAVKLRSSYIGLICIPLQVLLVRAILDKISPAAAHDGVLYLA